MKKINLSGNNLNIEEQISGSKAFGIGSDLIPGNKLLTNTEILDSGLKNAIEHWLHTGGEIEEVSGMNENEIYEFINDEYLNFIKISENIIKTLGKECLYPDIVESIYEITRHFSNDTLIGKIRSIFHLRKIINDNRIIRFFVIEYTNIIPLNNLNNHPINRHKRIIDLVNFDEIKTNSDLTEINTLLRTYTESLTDLNQVIFNVLDQLRSILKAPHAALVFENGNSIISYDQESERYNKAFDKRMHYLKNLTKEVDPLKKLKNVILPQISSGNNSYQLTKSHNNTGGKGKGVGSFIKIPYKELTDDPHKVFSDSDLRISFRDDREISPEMIYSTQFVADRIKNKILNFKVATQSSLSKDIFPKTIAISNIHQ